MVPPGSIGTAAAAGMAGSQTDIDTVAVSSWMADEQTSSGTSRWWLHCRPRTVERIGFDDLGGSARRCNDSSARRPHGN
jgi:hypothetical protein